MIKNSSMWAIYTASYFIDYVLILVILLWEKKQNIAQWKDFMKYCTSSDWIIWSILVSLIIFSIVVMHRIKRILMTTRIKNEPEDDSVWEVYSGFLVQAIALILSFFEEHGLYFSLVFFIIGGIAFIKSKQVYLASVFIFPLGYKIYKGTGNVKIITKESKDGLRLKLAEDVDGVEAKELAKGIFLIHSMKR